MANSYDTTISYENEESGRIIIKGKYRDGDNYLMARVLKYVLPYVSFQLDIQCDNGRVSLQITNVEYSYVVINESAYGLGDEALKILMSELRAIRSLMIRWGEVWTINDSFEQAYQTLESSVGEAKRVKDDKSLSRKERKKFKEYFERNDVKCSVYRYAVWAKSNVDEVVFKKKDSLADVLNSYIEMHKKH